MTRCKEFKNGWTAFFSPLPNGWFETYIRDARGDLHDRIRCDTRRDAMDYYKAFQSIAKNA